MKSLELFAGIGGIALAEQIAGIEVVALSEMADFPVRVLKKNFPGIPILPTDDDRDLWPEMFRIVQEIRPHWVVGENVANFANMELDRTLSNLERIGYQTRAFVLPACAVGAFHQRKRTFIVANSYSKRWQCLDESQEDRCIREFTKSTNVQEWQTRGYNPNDLLSAGAKEIATGSCRFQRNDDGLSEGVDRLKALGNAVVPQQVLPIFQAIMKIEEVEE